VSFDFRGHGASGGSSTVGDAEVLDLDAAVAATREYGYQRVVTVGFSMGGAVAIRQAALRGVRTLSPPDGVVTLSAVSRWYRVGHGADAPVALGGHDSLRPGVRAADAGHADRG